MSKDRWILAFVIHLVLGSGIHAEDWPCWRGPRGDGTSAETNVPTRWSAGENIVWKTEIPGVGHASPIVSGDRVFTVSALIEPDDRAPDRGGNSATQDSQIRERVLLCLDRATGKRLWQRTIVSSPLEGKHRLNSWASSTP